MATQPTVHQLNGPSALLPLISAFTDLSVGTEFASYKEPHWRFLLSGEDIAGYVVQSREDGSCFDGCVLKVNLENDNIGFGMVLVIPSKRGKGLARALLEKAMQTDATEENDMQAKSNKQGDKRYVLAVCSALGQPVYRKLGFKEVGMVTVLTCSIFHILQTPRQRLLENEHMSVTDGKNLQRDQLELLLKLDAEATGFKRKDRIKILLCGHAEGSHSTVAILATGESKNCISTAVARQDCIDGPLIIGPMRGKEKCAIPLVHALIDKHFEGKERNEINNILVQIMITGHPNLVARMLEINGMNRMWQSPAMSSDGKSVYLNGDGSYLAMMHPTLG